jgi:hypothetical protein
MSAGGPSSIGSVGAVSRVRKVAAAQRLYGKDGSNHDREPGGRQQFPRKPPCRSGTDEFEPIRYGLWRHAPFVAQLIGQILPRKDVGSAVARATYDDRPRRIAAVFDGIV